MECLRNFQGSWLCVWFIDIGLATSHNSVLTSINTVLCVWGHNIVNCYVITAQVADIQNHYLDCLCYSHVASSLVCICLSGQQCLLCIAVLKLSVLYWTLEFSWIFNKVDWGTILSLAKGYNNKCVSLL